VSLNRPHAPPGAMLHAMDALAEQALSGPGDFVWVRVHCPTCNAEVDATIINKDGVTATECPAGHPVYIQNGTPVTVAARLVGE